MTRIRQAVGAVLMPGLIAVGLLLAVDHFFGASVLEMNRFDGAVFTDNSARIAHPVFHHTLAADMEGTEHWGPFVFDLCTNAAGFRVDCHQRTDARKEFDIGFIGDSFTEGIGLPFGESFVGQISRALPDTAIANLAVASYAPTIYLAKINYLLNHGYRFDEIVVYVDISDIQDEGRHYELVDDRVRERMPTGDDDPDLDETGPDGPWARVKRWSKRQFPLVFQGLHEVKSGARMLYLGPHYLRRGHVRSAWTYEVDPKFYGEGGAAAAIEKARQTMIRLHDLLRSKGTALSVGVYPWPGQLLYDTVESRQVRIWREFCRTRCRYFYNSFPAFFAEVDRQGVDKAIETLFLRGDFHHNAKGSELIARDFLRKWEAR